jgi:2-amino-4-hydroxy-6-hydroxymethyldihydropteridine diphosphokinase
MTEGRSVCSGADGERPAWPRFWLAAAAAGMSLALAVLAVRKARRAGAPVLAFLGLGSNLGDRAGNLARAAAMLGGPGLRVVGCSTIYETPPWGKVDQPPFLNQVLEVNTTLDPVALLARCQEVERALGRVRAERWGPRVIDVDILLYGNARIRTRGLTVPHAELHRRAFALVPLLELWPDAALPDGRGAAELLQTLPERGEIVSWPRSGT